MSESRRFSGPQFSAGRAEEHEAVRTTIVGGRPPGSGQKLGDIPRGIEVLVKKAAVDPAFKELLLSQRAKAAEEIELQLEPAEVIMLRATPAEHLEAIIDRTTVPQEHRRVFLGRAATAMLAVLGLSQVGCESHTVTGIAPDEVPPVEGIRPDRPTATKGVRPDLPEQTEPPQPEQPDSSAESEQPVEQSTSEPMDAAPDQIIRGTRPDQPPAPTGSRPDLP